MHLLTLVAFDFLGNLSSFRPTLPALTALVSEPHPLLLRSMHISPSARHDIDHFGFSDFRYSAWQAMPLPGSDIYGNIDK